MGTHQDKLDHWRRQRAVAKAKRLAAELRRKPMNIRPGGNTTSSVHTFERTTRELEEEPEPPPPPPPPPPRPVLKHVPQNTHRAGSIAYALLYSYWIPNATEPR